MRSPAVVTALPDANSDQPLLVHEVLISLSMENILADP